MSFTNSREKNAKRCLLLSGLILLEKISFFLCSGPRKKNLFRDEMNAKSSHLFPHFLQHRLTMAASSLTAAALGSKVAFANKVRSRTRVVVYTLRSFVFYCCFICARASYGRVHERDNFLCKILSSLPVHERNTLLPKARKRGYKTHSFTPKRRRLAICLKIFLNEDERPSLDLAFRSRIVDFTSV